MNPRLRGVAIPGLRWVVGLVVLLESARFALSPNTAHEVAKIGLPPWIPSVLGGSEVIAALLFLVPPTTMAGGYALLAIFAIAIVIHFFTGSLTWTSCLSMRCPYSFASPTEMSELLGQRLTALKSFPDKTLVVSDLSPSSR